MFKIGDYECMDASVFEVDLTFKAQRQADGKFASGTIYHFVCGQLCEGSDWIVLGTQRLMEYKSWQSGKYDFIFEFPSRPTLDQLTGSLDNAVAEAVTNEYEAEFGADGRLAQERGLTGIP